MLFGFTLKCYSSFEKKNNERSLPNIQTKQTVDDLHAEFQKYEH